MNRWLPFVVLSLFCTPAVTAEVESFLEPFVELELAANQPGVLTHVDVEEGDTIREAQRLATLDTRVLEAQLRVFAARAKSRSRIESAKAETQLREQRLDSLRKLDQRGHANPAELQRALADWQVAKWRLAAEQDEQGVLQLEMDRIKAEIERRHIVSPIDGVVVAIHCKQGESVPVAAPEVVTVAQLDPLRAQFPVPLSDVAGIKAGARVSLTLPDLGQQREATVELVSPVMDPKSRTVSVTILIDNPRRDIIAGSRCLLELPANTSASQNRRLPRARAEQPRNRLTEPGRRVEVRRAVPSKSARLPDS